MTSYFNAFDVTFSHLNWKNFQ